MAGPGGIETAYALLDAGNLRGARDIFKAILQENPTDIQALTGAGLSFLDENPTKSRLCARLALKQAPESWEALELMALALRALNKPKDALPYALKRAELAPFLAGSHSLLADIHWDLNRTKPCFKAFEKALELEPDNPQLLARIASLHAETGQFDTAFALIDQALRLQPDSPEVLTSAGLCHLLRGETETARQFALSALQRQADNEGAVRLLIMAKSRANWIAGLIWSSMTAGLQLERRRLLVPVMLGLFLAWVIFALLAPHSWVNVGLVALALLNIPIWGGPFLLERMIRRELRDVALDTGF